jgi:alpha,alpha-trehalose phosphorylase
MRDHAGVLSFAPRLPDGLTTLSFSIVRRKLCLRVKVTARAATYRLTRGTGTLQIIHHGEPLTLSGSDPIERPIPAWLPRESPAQPPGREPRRRSPGGVPR